MAGRQSFSLDARAETLSEYFVYRKSPTSWSRDARRRMMLSEMRCVDVLHRLNDEIRLRGFVVIGWLEKLVYELLHGDMYHNL